MSGPAITSLEDVEKYIEGELEDQDGVEVARELLVNRYSEEAEQFFTDLQEEIDRDLEHLRDAAGALDPELGTGEERDVDSEGEPVGDGGPALRQLDPEERMELQAEYLEENGNVSINEAAEELYGIDDLGQSERQMIWNAFEENPDVGKEKDGNANVYFLDDEQYRFEDGKLVLEEGETEYEIPVEFHGDLHFQFETFAHLLGVSRPEGGELVDREKGDYLARPYFQALSELQEKGVAVGGEDWSEATDDLELAVDVPEELRKEVSLRVRDHYADLSETYEGKVIGREDGEYRVMYGDSQTAMIGDYDEEPQLGDTVEFRLENGGRILS